MTYPVIKVSTALKVQGSCHSVQFYKTLHNSVYKGIIIYTVIKADGPNEITYPKIFNAHIWKWYINI